MRIPELMFVSFLISATAYGQGELYFENSNSSKVGYSSDGIHITTPYTFASQPTVRIALYYQADPGGAAPAPIPYFGDPNHLGNWQFYGVVPLANPAPPGIFNGGSIQLPGIAGGANVWIQLLAWDNSGTTLSQAYASANMLASSTVFAVATIDPTLLPKPTDNLLSSNPAFTGIPFFTPEPPAVMIGAVGAVIAIILRRAKISN